MYDVVIIGAGVVGSAIARELSRYQLNICVVEKEEDVCSGTSKANSAIVHSGVDAKAGTLKAKLNLQGSQMMESLSAELDIPYKKNGSLIVCTSEENLPRLDELMERGKENGIAGLRILNREEALSMEPNIADGVIAALYAPTGAIICPFELTLGLAENAVMNGVRLKLNTCVNDIQKRADGFLIITQNETIKSRMVVNAAGVYSAEIHNMVSEIKYAIQARRGNYCLLDKSVGNHVKKTIFQLPDQMGKGVLVTPTVHGNLLIGPTAVDIDDKEGVNTTREELDYLTGRAALGVKNIPMRQVITSFAGLRAHEASDDFIIKEVKDVKGFIDTVGIESPGLSSAPAIGAMVADMVCDTLNPEAKTDFAANRKGITKLSELSFAEQKELINKNRAYGNIICRCETISEGEILDAIHRPLGAKSIDGIKRRTRAGMGRCQSGFCLPRVMEILKRELSLSMFDISKAGGESKIVCNHNKDNL